MVAVECNVSVTDAGLSMYVEKTFSKLEEKNKTTFNMLIVQCVGINALSKSLYPQEVYNGKSM